MNTDDNKPLDPILSDGELQSLLARLSSMPKDERTQLNNALEGLSEARFATAVRQILSMSPNSNSAAYGIKDPREPDPGRMNPNPPFPENLRHLAVPLEDSEDGAE